MGTPKNEIVVYQPDSTLRLDVRLGEETVWLSQEQMCELFQRERSVITKHVRNVFAEGECDERNNVQILHIKQRGRPLALFSLDVIISVGYRVKSLRGTQFRRWATGVLKEYLLRGYAVNRRLDLLEDKLDRRLHAHDNRLSALEGKVDFFVQTQTPPLRGVFFGGQLWDARSFAEQLIARAQTSLLLIDNWVGPSTLDLLAKKQNGVRAEIVTSPRGNALSPTDIANFNAQYPSLAVRTSSAFHDRFLILDDHDLYLIGASLKDLGKKCFAFSRLSPLEIPKLKSRI